MVKNNLCPRLSVWHLHLWVVKAFSYREALKPGDIFAKGLWDMKKIRSIEEVQMLTFQMGKKSDVKSRLTGNQMSFHIEQVKEKHQMMECIHWMSLKLQENVAHWGDKAEAT